MILDNNKYFTTLATIPVSGITPDILDLEIHIDNEKDKNKHLAIHSILKLMPWCTHIKHTQTTNKILVLTTKNQLMTAHQWLDHNLGPLFTKHLPKTHISVNSLMAPSLVVLIKLLPQKQQKVTPKS